MYKLFFLGCLIVGVSALLFRVYFEKSLHTSLTEYEENIDYSCVTDSDCMIGNVGNCCGYYPECVNKNAHIDGDFVREKCAEEGLGGICGFPSIEGCACVEGHCIGQVKEYE